jgi:hypothetical protein
MPLGPGSESGSRSVNSFVYCWSSSVLVLGLGSGRYIWVPSQKEEVKQALDNVTNSINQGIVAHEVGNFLYNW